METLKLTKSEARKLQWKNKTPEERRIHAQKMAKARHSKLTFLQRREHALKMLEAKKLKKL